MYHIDYEYTGSNGFFGNASGNSMNIDDLERWCSCICYANGWTHCKVVCISGPSRRKSWCCYWLALMAQGMDMQTAQQTAGQMAGAAIFLPGVVEKAQDFRLYLRYRF